MSFSADCKQELCSLPPEKPCCPASELSGLFMTMGSLSLLGRGRLSVQLSSENLAVCRRAYTLLSKQMLLAPQIHYLTSSRFGGRRKCVLTLGPNESPTFLRKLHMMERAANGEWSLRSTTPRLPITRACCARAFLRGVMLGGGTMANPDTSYHLELPYQNDEMRQMLAKCLQRIDLPIRDGTRGEKRFLYLKQAEQLVTFLTAIGAHQAILRIEELRLRKQLIGKINRAMNCDAFNLSKQMTASAKQVEIIRELDKKGMLEGMSESLREVARLRLEMPDATLEQLGQSMTPPLGKSGVNHRLRRLMEYAESIGDAPKEE